MLNKTGILMVLVGVLCAASNPPSISAGKEQTPVEKPTNAAQSDNPGYECGTKDRPCVVYVETAPESQSEASQDADYQERKTADEDARRIAIVSIIVGASQTLVLAATFVVIAGVAVRQLRAYLVPGIEDVVKFSLTEPIQIRMGIKNVGATPARDVQTHSVAFIGGFPLPDDAESTAPPFQTLPSGKHSKLTIYPGDSGQNSIISVIDTLNPEIIEILKQPSPKAAIYVAATTYYRDIFGRKRKTEFCRYIDSDDVVKMISIEEGVPIKPFAVRFVACHILNYFT